MRDGFVCLHFLFHKVIFFSFFADSFYQRNIRWDSENFMETVKHHEARVLNPICMERMKLIPKTFGGDWRDLPNIKITLPNGQQTVKLRYPYIDWKTGRPAVCSCRQRKGAVSLLFIYFCQIIKNFVKLKNYFCIFSRLIEM